MKRFLSVMLIVLILTLSVSAASAASNDLSDTGKTVVTIGDWVYEAIEGGKYWELDEYLGNGGRIIIPRIVNDMMVTSIGSHCFVNNTTVTSVSTSSPLWSVGDYAFLNCTSLERFECNFALKEIGVGAFSGAASLSEINLRDSVLTEIKPHTFMSSGVEDIALPKTCVSIGNYAFSQCASLSKISIPNSVTEISETAFDGCDSLVIYGKHDSYAIEYAIAHNIDYVMTDAVTYVLGDADNDEDITIIDVSYIQRVLASIYPDEDGMIALRGDVDYDGLDITDATWIQRWLVSLPFTEPIGEEVTRFFDNYSD